MNLGPFLVSIAKYAPYQIAQGIIGLVSIPILTKAYSPGDYGSYSLAMITLTILVVLIGWLPMSIIRFYAGYDEQNKLNQLYIQVIISSIISIVVIGLAYFLAVSFISTHLSLTLVYLMKVAAGLFFVTAVFEVCLSLLMAKGLPGWYSIFSVIRVIGSFLISLFFIYVLHLGIECLLYANIIATVICIPLLYKKAVDRILPRSPKLAKFRSIVQMLQYGLPLVVGNVASWVLSVSDRYVLEIFRGEEAVGVYSVAYGIADRSLMLPVNLLMLASAPILIRVWETLGENECKNHVYQFTRFYIILCLPSCLGLCVLSRTIVQLMTSEKYVDGFMVIPFVAIGIFLFGMQARYQSGLILHKKTVLISSAVISAGTLNLVLNFLSVPFFGFLAAAVNTLISYLALLVGMIFLSKRYFIWPFPVKSLIRVSLSAGAMAFVVLLIDSIGVAPSLIKLTASVSIGVLTYLVGLVLLKEFSVEEIAAAKSYFWLMTKCRNAEE